MRDFVQNWFANRGYGQYALPRSKPRPRVDHVGLRLVVGALGLFFTILFGGIVLIMIVFGGAFIFGALSGG